MRKEERVGHNGEVANGEGGSKALRESGRGEQDGWKRV